MKKLSLSIAVVMLLAVGAGQALARPQHATASKVTVVMRDPGCHWFSVGGKFTTKLAVKGPAQVLNVDEAAIRIVGAGSVERIPVGKTVVLRKGSYTITMVGQAPDDNHLKLVVR